jgi:hypothetical protein
MEQRSLQSYRDKLDEALTHIEKNRALAYNDLKDGDGYEALEYLENMGVWIKDAQQELAALVSQRQEEQKS